MRYIFTTLLALFCLALQAQIDFPAGTPVVNGYDITYTNPNLNGETLYLCGNYGNQLFVVDSAVVKKGIASFHNKKAVLPCGVYTLSKDPRDHFFSNWKNFITVVLNKSNQVQISQEGSFSYHQAQDLKVTGSEETTLLNRFLYNICNSAAVVDPDSLKPLCEEFCGTMPQSFLSKYVQAQFGWLTEHDARILNCQDAFKDVPYTDFSEPRLLYSPLPLFWMYKNIADCEIHDSDVLIQLTDSLLSRCSNELTRNYFVEQLFKLFDNHDPDQDPVLLHLYDNYDHGWIEEGSERRIERKIQNLRKIIPGATDDSYGIEVAKLAGVPNSVVNRARAILKELEETAAPVHMSETPKAEDDDPLMQLSFAGGAGSEIIDELKTIDVNTLTPIEAMQKLYEMVNEAKKI